MKLKDLFQVIDDTTMVRIATNNGNMLAPLKAIRLNLRGMYEEANVFRVSPEDKDTIYIILEEAL